MKALVSIDVLPNTLKQMSRLVKICNSWAKLSLLVECKEGRSVNK